MSKLLSVVIPVYNSANSLEKLFESLQREISSLEDQYELIFVDDGSRDGSRKILQEISANNRQTVTVIFLAENFGQQNAIMAGLRRAAGEYIVTMDDDLQHDPADIGLLRLKAEEGYELVYGIPKSKQHHYFRGWGTLLTDLFFTVFLRKNKSIKISSFRIMRQNLKEKIVEDKGSFVYISAIALRHTSNIAVVETNHQRSARGHSSYTVLKLVRLYLNLFFNYSGLFKQNKEGEQYRIAEIIPREQ